MSAGTPASTRPWTVVEGVRIHCVEAGSGSTVVLLHPVPGWSGSFREVLPALATRHRVLAPDLRGHGESDKPRGDYSLPAQARLLLRWLDARGVGATAFVGAGYGGILALYLGAHHPDRVRALVLSGMNAYTSFRFPPAVRLLSSRVGWPLARLAPRWLFERGYLAQLHDPSRASRQHLDELWRWQAPADARWCTWQQSRQIDFALLERHLSRVSAPTLLVWGRQDRASPLVWAERMARDIPGARLTTIDGCGHFPPVERPAELSRLAHELLDELREQER